MKKSELAIGMIYFCMAMFAIGTNATTQYENNYQYIVLDEKVTIVDVSFVNPIDVVIPTTLGGYPVEKIGDSAFSGSEITSVVIPKGIVSIGSDAFRDCHNLMRVSIPDTVTSIGSHAFYDCDLLEDINVPNSVTYIGKEAFSYCHNLLSLNIPDSVTFIGSYAFQYCDGLTNIRLSCNITSIEMNTFYCCDSLKSIIIPSSVISIENNAFYKCRSLKSIIIPSSVIDIDSSAFSHTNACFTIYGYNESEAENFAKEHNIPFIPLYTISGKISSVGTGDITISLLKDGTTVEGVTVTVDSTEGTYTIVYVPAGTYTMRVSKPRHITREYTVTVGNP